MAEPSGANPNPFAEDIEAAVANPKDATMAAWFGHNFGDGMADYVLVH
jgi:hypothetical protein